MSDIDSKKDNSTKIGDYGKKLGTSIFKFCILILIGCLVLYASKACGSGILDIIIQTYCIKGLTDTLIDPTKTCNKIETNPIIESNVVQKGGGGENDSLEKSIMLEEEGQFLNQQYINRIKIKGKEKSQYQKIIFLPNPDIQQSVWSDLNTKLNIIRQQMANKPRGNKSPTQKRVSFFELFITGVISNITVFNLTFIKSTYCLSISFYKLIFYYINSKIRKNFYYTNKFLLNYYI